jgi:hypothetical protein
MAICWTGVNTVGYTLRQLGKAAPIPKDVTVQIIQPFHSEAQMVVVLPVKCEHCGATFNF